MRHLSSIANVIMNQFITFFFAVVVLFLKTSSIWFYSRTLDYLFFGSWLPRCQCLIGDFWHLKGLGDPTTGPITYKFLNLSLI